MPALADIVVKKNDNLTNITFTGVVPSSGDGVPAVWKSQSVGSAVGFQPEIRLASRAAKGGQEREHSATFFYPQLKTDTTTSVTSVHRKLMGKVTWTTPVDMAATDVAEASAQFANLLASTLFRSCINSGYSAT